MSHAELLRVLTDQRHAELERAAAIRRLIRQRRLAQAAANRTS